MTNAGSNPTISATTGAIERSAAPAVKNTAFRNSNDVVLMMDLPTISISGDPGGMGKDCNA